MDVGCYAIHQLRSLAGEEPEVVSARRAGAFSRHRSVRRGRVRPPERSRRQHPGLDALPPTPVTGAPRSRATGASFVSSTPPPRRRSTASRSTAMGDATERVSPTTPPTSFSSAPSPTQYSVAGLSSPVPTTPSPTCGSSTPCTEPPGWPPRTLDLTTLPRRRRKAPGGTGVQPRDTPCARTPQDATVRSRVAASGAVGRWYLGSGRPRTIQATARRVASRPRTDCIWATSPETGRRERCAKRKISVG